ncbi:MAG: ATP-binding cassette domain-containing protein [Spirobacillus cienkowskii]|jgi:ABC-type multidrug transport system fused ATPase/permease subunit|uniref:ATP-binding cassette domain-containing protein n=1 Tax=Spirobacillus cienkowskii TaxID=495820 RepID=A0A369KU85_9BACT|nr:MAG: ATP-binding cassette domain-containing protein [Spirobacillus cienkowskii]
MLKFVKFIGKKASLSLFCCFLSSLFLGGLEIFIAFFIQIFLLSLGLINTELSLFNFQLSKFSINYAIAILILIGFFRFLYQFSVMHFSVYSVELINTRLRSVVVYDLLFKKSENSLNASEANFKISEIFPKTLLFILNLVNFLGFFLQLVVLFFCMFYSSWKDSCVAITGIFIIGILVLFINKRIKIISDKVPNEQSVINYSLSNVFKNLLFIKIMKTENKENKSLINSILHYSSFSIKCGFLNNFSYTITPFFGILLLVVIVLTSQHVWFTPPLILLSFIYLLIRFIQYLSNFVNSYGFLSIYYPQYKNAINYFFSSSENLRNEAVSYASYLKFNGRIKLNKLYQFLNEEKHTLTHYNSNIIETPPKISFNNVTFNYPNSANSVFKTFNFHVESGSQIGIIGPSGSGKSTILFLLLGILKPSEGDIKIDNLTPEEFLNNPKNRIGYVGPDPFLIKGSIKENLCYGISFDVSEEEIYNALDSVALKDFIALKGLDYQIAEDQSGLSSGQKQRVCLARAILNKPQLLVLDEATANLDDATEQEIAKVLFNLKNKCTIVIVSHRPGILKWADKIITLQ